MRFPWSRKRQPEVVKAVQQEAEEAKRSIEVTKPIVEEAVKRTNDSFVAVEEETRQAAIELALLKDLHRGWTRHR